MSPVVRRQRLDDEYGFNQGNNLKINGTTTLEFAPLICNKVQNRVNAEKISSNLKKINKKDAQGTDDKKSGAKRDAILVVKKEIESGKTANSGVRVTMDLTLPEPSTQDNNQPERTVALDYCIRNLNCESENNDEIKSNGSNGKLNGSMHETDANVIYQAKSMTKVYNYDADEVHPNIVKNRLTKSFLEEITGDENLPSGWVIHIHKKGVRMKQSSNSEQTKPIHSTGNYSYYFTKKGKRLRSKPEVQKFLSHLSNVNGDEDVAWKRFKMNAPSTRDFGIDIRSLVKKDQLEMRSSTGSRKNSTHYSCLNSIVEEGNNTKDDSDLGARCQSDCVECGEKVQGNNNGFHCLFDCCTNTKSGNSPHNEKRDTELSFNSISSGVIEIMDDDSDSAEFREGGIGLNYRKAESIFAEEKPFVEKCSTSNTHSDENICLPENYIGRNKLPFDDNETARKDAEIVQSGEAIEILDDDDDDDNNNEILMSSGVKEVQFIKVERRGGKSTDSIVKTDYDEVITINDDDDNDNNDSNFWQDDDRPSNDDDDIEIIEAAIDEEEARIRQELERKMRVAAEKREKEFLKIQEEGKMYREETLKLQEMATKKREELLLKAHRKRKKELLNSHKTILKNCQKEEKTFSSWTYYKAKSQKRAPDASPNSKSKKKKFSYNFIFTCEDEALREQERLLQESAARVRILGDHQRIFGISGGMKDYKEVVTDVRNLPTNHYKWSCMYSRLGVPKRSCDDVVKRNYRRLCLLYHPDKAKCNDAPAKFQAIKEAYESIVKGINCK